jgi:DNA-binding HxlR family transcriptional regulator
MASYASPPYGYRRFKDLAGYTGAPRDVLASRLRRLEEIGILERRPYSERPPRHEYHLAAKVTPPRSLRRAR